MEQSIMTKLLEGQDKMIEKLATVSEIVRRHDEVTFPEMKAELTKQSNSLYRMESKQNEDMTKFIAEKEEIYKRLTPLELDLRKRLESSKDTNNRWKGIFWGGVEKVIYIVIGGTVMYWQLIKTKLDL